MSPQTADAILILAAGFFAAAMWSLYLHCRNGHGESKDSR